MPTPTEIPAYWPAGSTLLLNRPWADKGTPVCVPSNHLVRVVPGELFWDEQTRMHGEAGLPGWLNDDTRGLVLQRVYFFDPSTMADDKDGRWLYHPVAWMSPFQMDLAGTGKSFVSCPVCDCQAICLSSDRCIAQPPMAELIGKVRSPAEMREAQQYDSFLARLDMHRGNPDGEPTA